MQNHKNAERSGCLTVLVMILKKMMFGASTRIIRKATTINGYISMLIGCGITILVQSSSVTTSVLTPLVGVGLITVEQVSSRIWNSNAVASSRTSPLWVIVACIMHSPDVPAYAWSEYRYYRHWDPCRSRLGHF